MALKLGVTNYYALASGFLTGKYRSLADLHKSQRGEKASKYLDERGQRILGSLDKVSGKHDSSPTAVALAWQIARPSITAPIASATSVEQLKTFGAAIRLKLDAEDI